MNERPAERHQTIGTFLSPSSFIEAARDAHPAFRFAIVAAGIVAIVAIIAKWGVNYATLVFGAIALIGLMVIFALFAQIPKLTRSTLHFPALVLVWTFLIVIVAFVAMLTTSTFFDGPLPFRSWIVRQLEAERSSGQGGSDNVVANSAGEAISSDIAATVGPVIDTDPTTSSVPVEAEIGADQIAKYRASLNLTDGQVWQHSTQILACSLGDNQVHSAHWFLTIDMQFGYGPDYQIKQKLGEFDLVLYNADDDEPDARALAQILRDRFKRPVSIQHSEFQSADANLNNWSGVFYYYLAKTCPDS